MEYVDVFRDIGLCLWGVFSGICRGVFRFFLPGRHKCVRGQKVLITGAGNGLGRLLCLQFARLGGQIVAWDVDEAGLERTRDEVEYLGAKIHIYVCDLSKHDDVIRTASHVRQDVGDVDVLINNAGTVNGKTLLDHSGNDVTKIFNVNVLSQFWMLECFLPAMIARNSGHIVSISSVAAIFACNRMGSYCSTKFAVNGLMESLRCELLTAGHTGVHTTTVCPYFMNTHMFNGCKVKFPSLFPCLEPELVARRTVQAVLTNQTVLYVPRTFYLLSTLKTLLPAESMAAVLNHLGANTLMDGYVGRSASQQSQHALDLTHQRTARTSASSGSPALLADGPTQNGMNILVSDRWPEDSDHKTEIAERGAEILDHHSDNSVIASERNDISGNVSSLPRHDGVLKPEKVLNGNAELRRSVERVRSAEA